MNELHKSRKEFQLERMILFSDAVFAIAITLLVIEIKVPELHEKTDAELGKSLVKLIPKLVGFLLSFFLIGLYWTVHHRICGLLHDYTPKLLWLNLFFLLSIALMPFSTAFYSEYSHPALKVPYALYVGNICLTGYSNFLLWRYMSNPKHNLTFPMDDARRKFGMWRTLLVPIIFLLSFAFSFVEPFSARMMPMLIPVTMMLLQKIFLKPGENSLPVTAEEN